VFLFTPPFRFTSPNPHLPFDAATASRVFSSLLRTAACLTSGVLPPARSSILLNFLRSTFSSKISNSFQKTQFRFMVKILSFGWLRIFPPLSLRVVLLGGLRIFPLFRQVSRSFLHTNVLYVSYMPSVVVGVWVVFFWVSYYSGSLKVF